MAPRHETLSLAPFDLHTRGRLVFGSDSLLRVGELARELGGQRVLLVTDYGIVAAGHVDRARQALEAAGVAVAGFAEVRENPTTLDVDRCVEKAREHRADLLVGLGGGSAMDTAKGCNFLFTNGGRMQDYWGVGKATRPMLPFIAIPTTAGTGSECQSAALIADEATHQKMACLDPKAAARIAVLDPVLTLSQPRHVAASTGIDAIAHAVESAVTVKRNALSVMYAVEAFRLGASSLPGVIEQPGDVANRGRMLLGSALAGTAIEYSMLGAAHAAANPLTAHYGLVHGQAVGLMLPHVVRYNGHLPAARHTYAELASAIEVARVSDGHERAWLALVACLDRLLDVAGFPRSLAECGVQRDRLPGLAAEAARQWTARFNPRPVSASDFEGLYAAALEPRPSRGRVG